MELQPQDIPSERAALALSLLAAHKSVILVPPISLTNYPGEPLTLIVWSNWQLENLTDDIALNELLTGRRAYSALLDNWDELKRYVGNRHLPCYLHEDYGTGSIRVAELLPGGSLKWHANRSNAPHAL